jgi:hypothetical protein
MSVVRSIQTYRLYLSRNVDVDNAIRPYLDPDFRARVKGLLGGPSEEPLPDAPQSLEEHLSLQFPQVQVEEMRELARQAASGPIAERKADVPAEAVADDAFIEADFSENKHDSSNTARLSTRLREPSAKALENIANQRRPTLFNYIVANLYTMTPYEARKQHPIADPASDVEAFSGKQAGEWKIADQAEINQLIARGTWRLVHPSEVPRGKRILGVGMVRTIKWQANPDLDLAPALMAKPGNLLWQSARLPSWLKSSSRD